MTALSADEALGANESLARDLGEAGNLLTRYGLSHEGMELRALSTTPADAETMLQRRIDILQSIDWLHSVGRDRHESIAALGKVVESAAGKASSGDEWTMKKEQAQGDPNYKLIFDRNDGANEQDLPGSSVSITVRGDHAVTSIEAVDYTSGSVVRSELILTE